MLAEDKLGEAEFFLKKMKLCREGRGEFRYYLSAFLSATRSVTWVLQKDLRTKHGEQFEKWYKEQELKMASNQTAALVKFLRNVVLKEGARLPIYTLKIQNPEQSSEYVEYKYDLGTLRGKGRLVLSYFLPENEANIIIDELDETSHIDIEEQFKEKIQKKLPDIVAHAIDLSRRAFNEIEPEKFVSFNEDETPKPLKLWTRELERYLALLSEIIAEAKSIFKS